MSENERGSRRGAGQTPRSPRRRGTLLEPAVLAVLAGQAAHGYDVSRAVVEITAGFVRADRGGTYRLLRRLEDEGFVTSTWIEGEFGPQRRRYRLTAAGRALLAQWRHDLDRRRRAFGSVLDAIDRVLEPPAESRRLVT